MFFPRLSSQGPLGSAQRLNLIAVMDINFKCPNCGQELSADESGAGSAIQCPACNGNLVIPAAAGPPGGNLNPIASSAAAREHKHFSVPQREKAADPLIAKPLKPLDAVAFERAVFVERHRGVERGLAAKGGEQNQLMGSFEFRVPSSKLSVHRHA